MSIPSVIHKLMFFSRYADGALAAASVVMAVIYAVDQNWLAASLWIVGAIISAACFHWQPAKWLARKHLIG